MEQAGRNENEISLGKSSSGIIVIQAAVITQCVAASWYLPETLPQPCVLADPTFSLNAHSVCHFILGRYRTKMRA